MLEHAWVCTDGLHRSHQQCCQGRQGVRHRAHHQSCHVVYLETELHHPTYCSVRKCAHPLHHPRTLGSPQRTPAADFENQGAHHLARQHDPEGKRTIGVLTKPDRIPAGEEAQWTRFIKNEYEPLDNGWFSVKQPSSKELKAGITWTDARRQEGEYFSSASVWSELEPEYQRYLGTANLTGRLSQVLSALIAKR